MQTGLMLVVGSVGELDGSTRLETFNLSKALKSVNRLTVEVQGEGSDASLLDKGVSNVVSNFLHRLFGRDGEGQEGAPGRER